MLAKASYKLQYNIAFYLANTAKYSIVITHIHAIDTYFICVYNLLIQILCKYVLIFSDKEWLGVTIYNIGYAISKLQYVLTLITRLYIILRWEKWLFIYQWQYFNVTIFFWVWKFLTLKLGKIRIWPFMTWIPLLMALFQSITDFLALPFSGDQITHLFSGIVCISSAFTCLLNDSLHRLELAS